MKGLTVVLLSVVSLARLEVGIRTRQYYVGAVVEYKPVNPEHYNTAAEVTIDNITQILSEVLTKVLAENTDRYLAFMSDASEVGTDIIVFPEYGVTGTKVGNEEDRVVARQFMVVGEVGRNYCDTINTNINDDILQRIGCAAVRYNMYVVVNIGEMVNCSQEVSISLFSNYLEMYY